jgi:hypothetical protein
MSPLLDCSMPPETTMAARRPTGGLLMAHATAAGLTVRAMASWPESAEDVLPQVAGFVVSTFSPLVAEVAERALRRRPDLGVDEAAFPVTAVILISTLGDLTSASHVAATVDAGDRVKPLMFFQSVPNAVAGLVAARWQLTGPVVCVGAIDTGLCVATVLIADGDADEALIVRVDQAYADGQCDHAEAVLVHAHTPQTAGEHGNAEHRSEGGQP